MMKETAGSIVKHFSILKDPRIERQKLHKLLDIIVITICAVICGADGWEEIEEYGKTKENYFKNFLELPNGIPSHDTFNRVFSIIKAKELQECFMNWIRTISEITKGEIVAIDGKTLRRSYNTHLLLSKSIKIQ